VLDIVATFGRHEECQRDGDELDDVIEAARSDGPQKRFQFREREFNGIEIRTVGREESEVRADAFDGGADFYLFVHNEVIKDDNIAGPQRRDQNLLDIREEARIVDRPIEYRGRPDPLGSQGRDHGLRLPMTARRMVVEARPARTPSVAPQ